MIFQLEKCKKKYQQLSKYIHKFVKINKTNKNFQLKNLELEKFFLAYNWNQNKTNQKNSSLIENNQKFAKKYFSKYSFIKVVISSYISKTFLD